MNAYDLRKGWSIKTPKEAVLLLNMGGPGNLYEVETFLRNMFNDPRIISVKSNFLRKIIAGFITSKRLGKSQAIYAAIGGKSPLTEITFSLTEKLNAADSSRFYTYANRYVPPYSDGVLQDLKNRGFESLVLFSMYPQYSTTTTLSSFDDVRRALKKLAWNPVIKTIDRFYDDPGFVRAICSCVKSEMKGRDPKEFVLIFSAHGLPQSIVDKGDPYQKECEKNVELLKQNLTKEGMEFSEVVLCYQSKVGPMKWIGPGTEETLAKRGGKNAIIYPLSFTIDNSETKYELCIQYEKTARKVGVKEYVVCPCLNDGSGFVKVISGLVKSADSRKDEK